MESVDEAGGHAILERGDVTRGFEYFCEMLWEQVHRQVAHPEAPPVRITQHRDPTMGEQFLASELATAMPVTLAEFSRICAQGPGLSDRYDM